MMKLERLSNNNSDLLGRALELYQSAFSAEERREESEHERVLKKETYHFDFIVNDGAFIGIMLYWETDEFIFAEHFALCPEASGKDFADRAVDLLKAKNKIIISCVKPPIDGVSQKTYDFYMHNGFFENQYTHPRVKYRLTDNDEFVKVLSYPRRITEEEYRSFNEFSNREVGIRPNMARDVTVRAIKDGDDLSQAAKLIYMTDPYIYPSWFDDMESGIKVIREMIDLPTLYNRENLKVAVLSDGFIAGIIVSKQAPFTEDYEQIRRAFEAAGVPIDARSEEIFNAYYAKMGGGEDGYYIANVAVDPKCRKRGIAAALIDFVTENKSYCTLECVAANGGSWRLYQRLGFKIAYEYPGVYDVPCYKMYYKKQEI